MTADQKLDAILAKLTTVEELVKAAVGRAALAGAQPSGAAGVVFPNYDKSKGEPVAGASERDLRFYGGGAQRSLADASKSRFHAKERALLAAINAELVRQGHEPMAEPQPGEGGGPDDGLADDLPF